MAGAPTYGATPARLNSEYFPGALQDSRRAGEDMAWGKLREVAEDVALEVRAAGLDPTAITEQGAPRSWGWLTRTILLGAAAEYGYAASQLATEVCDKWHAMFQERVRRLRESPAEVLSDVSSYQPSSSSVSIFR